jgi:HK97 family phage major capsid protein
MVDLVHGVDDNVVNRGIIVLSPNALGFIRKMKDTQDMPIWASFAAGQEPTILGRPYAIANQFPNTDSATKPFAMYGDFRHAFIGQRSGFQVAFSEDAGFTKATRYMRVLQRWAFAIPTGDAFCVLETSAV